GAVDRDTKRPAEAGCDRGNGCRSQHSRYLGDLLEYEVVELHRPARGPCGTEGAGEIKADGDEAERRIDDRHGVQHSRAVDEYRPGVPAEVKEGVEVDRE